MADQNRKTLGYTFPNPQSNNAFTPVGSLVDGTFTYRFAFAGGNLNLETLKLRMYTSIRVKGGPAADLIEMSLPGPADSRTTLTGGQAPVANDVNNALDVHFNGVAEVSTVDFTGHSIADSDFWLFETATAAGGTNAFYVWYEVDGSGGVDPTPGGTGIKVDVLSGDTDIEVAQKTQAAVQTVVGPQATIPVPATAVITITNAVGGAVTDVADGAAATGAAFATVVDGADPTSSDDFRGNGFTFEYRGNADFGEWRITVQGNQADTLTSDGGTTPTIIAPAGEIQWDVELTATDSTDTFYFGDFTDVLDIEREFFYYSSSLLDSNGNGTPERVRVLDAADVNAQEVLLLSPLGPSRVEEARLLILNGAGATDTEKLLSTPAGALAFTRFVVVARPTLLIGATVTIGVPGVSGTTGVQGEMWVGDDAGTWRVFVNIDGADTWQQVALAAWV